MNCARPHVVVTGASSGIGRASAIRLADAGWHVYAAVAAYVYWPGIPSGVLAADDRAMREIEDALRSAERSGDDHALTLTRVTLAVALVHRPTDAERDRGQRLLDERSDVFLRLGYLLGDRPIVEVYSVRERARCGDRDEAIPLMRAATDHLFSDGQLLMWGIPATGVLVETLLDRGTDADVAEAEAAIERLAAALADDGLVIRDIWLLRLSALLARARGDDVAYRDLVNRYRAMAKSLGFDGHMRWPRRCREGGGIVVEFDGSADFRSPVADGLVGDRE